MRKRYLVYPRNQFFKNLEMALPRPSLAIHCRGRQLADIVVREWINNTDPSRFSRFYRSPMRPEFHKFINFAWRSIKVTHPTTRTILFHNSCAILQSILALIQSSIFFPLPLAMRGMIFWEFEIQGKTEVVSLSISGTKNSQGKTTKTTN